MNKLEMWERLEPTNPKYTKPFTRGGGFRGTAINSTYVVRRLTDEFGPCGMGWRLVIESDRTEPGHTLRNGDRAIVHVVRGHLEYKIDGQWHATGPQFGQTMLVDENKNGTFTDEEAPKKSITDCLSKCAVLLGITADIHLGMFDDNKYVNARRAEEEARANPPPNPRPPSPIKPAAEPDPMAEEMAPTLIPTDGENNISWGQKFIAAINSASSEALIDEWEQVNGDALDAIARDAPKVFGRLAAALGAARSRVRKAKSPTVDALLDERIPGEE